MRAGSGHRASYTLDDYLLELQEAEREHGRIVIALLDRHRHYGKKGTLQVRFIAKSVDGQSDWLTSRDGALQLPARAWPDGWAALCAGVREVANYGIQDSGDYGRFTDLIPGWPRR